MERTMAEAKVLSGAGLRGQVAGQTALSTVGMAGAGLTYRGYDVRDLAAEARFEEVAYLLLYGELPDKAELSAYMDKLKGLRDLPAAGLEGSAGTHTRRHSPDGCHAHGCLHARHPGAGAQLRSAARPNRPSARSVPGDHVLLVSLQS
ncbi:hypothetical protein ALP51_102476 [Pseudomonas savastanoi]|uniref:Citrate synthase n=1 Tax=Pseudomonas savastanoi TaxID=29438 RepID=A0A3M5JP90_PSESS|nr:hypothetical protein ALP51_102476 [Pseudomonas savastanoi]